jgi:hypothetical protein
MISKENKRIATTVSKTIYKVLQDEAEYQGRTVGNLVSQIIKHYIKNKKNISLE